MLQGREFNAAELTTVMLEDFREYHATVALTELHDLMRRDPAWADAQRRVDGRFGRRAEGVKLFGKIEWSLDRLDETVAAVWAQLLKRAERLRLSGEYRDSMRIWADGQSYRDLAAVPQGVREVHFYPLVPYALKIERGQGRAPQAGVFRAAATWAKARFGAGARIVYDVTVPRDPDAAQYRRSNRGRAATIGKGRRRRQIGRRSAETGPIPVPRIRIVRGGNFR